MTSSTTTTSADVKDIQDRQANGRAAVLDATMVNGVTVDPKLIEAAMMALVEHWRAEADIWEASKRRGAVGTAKELRAAASRLAGFAVGLTTRPVGEGPGSQIVKEWQETRSALREFEQSEHPDIMDRHGRTWIWRDKDLYVHDETLAMTRDMIESPTLGLPSAVLADNPNYEKLCSICRRGWNVADQLERIAQDARSIIEQTQLTGDEPIGTKVIVGGVEFTKIGDDPFPFDVQATEEENLREMIGPLGASAIMDNPFVSPSINARPNVTIPFFALTEVATKLDADDLGRRERVSHSYVESYENCSLAALLRDASRAGHIGAQRPGWSTIGGNAFHAAVNVVELRAIAGIAAPLSISESLWLEHFEMQVNDRRQELAGTPYADPSTWYVSNRGKEGFDWWRVEGAKMLETYLKFHDQAWRAANQTLMVKDSTPCLELAYEMTVRSIDGERGITSKGFIDRAILSLGDHPTHPWHITVVDYKTGARDPISTFQLGEYAHALLLEMGLTDEPPGRPILGSYWLARKGIYTTPVPVIARHPLHELQYRYDAVMRGTTAGVFAPHVTNMCSSCSTVDYCPAQVGRS